MSLSALVPYLGIGRTDKHATPRLDSGAFSLLLARLGDHPSPGAVYDFCFCNKPVIASHTNGKAEATEVQQISKFRPH